MPINWNKLSSEALNLIKSFIEIFSFDDLLHGNGCLNQLVDDSSRFTRIKRVNSIGSPIRDQTPPTLDHQSPIPRSPKSTNPYISQKQLNPPTNKLQQNIINQLKKQKVFSFVYQENQNYKKHLMFMDSLLVINSLKGLSNLAMYSFTEDEYGIVQQTLPDIINTFIQLQKVYF